MYSTSQEKIAKFHGDIEKKATGSGIKSNLRKEDLDRLVRVVVIFCTQSPIDYFSYAFGSKWYGVYINLGIRTGLVYNGNLVKVNSWQSVPHGYGEFSYCFAGGSLFYAGYFHYGRPSGECRISIEGYGSCNGTMASFKHDNGEIGLYFSSLFS